MPEQNRFIKIGLSCLGTGFVGFLVGFAPISILAALLVINGFFFFIFGIHLAPKGSIQEYCRSLHSITWSGALLIAIFFVWKNIEPTPIHYYDQQKHVDDMSGVDNFSSTYFGWPVPLVNAEHGLRRSDHVAHKKIHWGGLPFIIINLAFLFVIVSLFIFLFEKFLEITKG